MEYLWTSSLDNSQDMCDVPLRIAADITAALKSAEGRQCCTTAQPELHRRKVLLRPAQECYWCAGFLTMTQYSAETVGVGHLVGSLNPERCAMARHGGPGSLLSCLPSSASFG